MIDYILNKNKMLGDNQLSYIVGTCLSTDAKPVLGIYFGSMLFETDTQSWYVFNKTKTWKKSSGSGGSTTVVANPESSGFNTLIVTEDGNGMLNKTWKEIYDSRFSVLIEEYETGYNVYYLAAIYVEEGVYGVYYSGVSHIAYTTDSENGYPSVFNPGDVPGGDPGINIK